MKTAVSPYLEKLDRIEADLTDAAHRIIAGIEQTIIDYVREEQLFEKGIDGKGVRLEPYSPYTVALKRIKGEVYNRTTLLDTGDFYDNMYVYAKGENFYLDSSDTKTPLLIGKYGKDILTLTEKHNDLLNQKEILPRLIQWIILELFK